MDDFTPMEPEYRELPPEQPAQNLYYYGTGIQTQPKKSKLPWILTALTVLMAINVTIVAIFLFSEPRTQTRQEPDDEQLFAPDDTLLLQPQTTGDAWKDPSLKGIYDRYADGTAVVTAQSSRGLICATAMILTEDGYLLTKSDILDNASELFVTLPDGTSCVAAFVGIDASSDMAILKVDREGLTPSDIDADERLHAQQSLDAILQSSAHGASLGVEVGEIPEPYRIYWQLPQGVIVNRLLTSSNAYRAGLRAGDVLVQIERTLLTDLSDYMQALRHYSAGQAVRIYFYRDGNTYYVDVCLEAAQFQ